eukprot:CAMPEP_0173384654 /NCGR_PEP_ID=MMETSP1356-20130122/7225_1 /TAXON_ID=77927 ORGANISM="Hemiselmis virescens, Strain PCC157" /NCGR_SAMPLE_ID=MMETSP1356 /ASSEMBLY_ACC=CAM_ASM_000847 /LENGTH=220 /DNA_ID=CAMNT_0014340117 /DNA_START=384 /DNA_END=1046 /DNA_ORIENTATION=+
MIVAHRANRDAKNRQKRKEKERALDYVPADTSTKVEAFDNGDDEKKSSKSDKKAAKAEANGSAAETGSAKSAWGGSGSEKKKKEKVASTKVEAFTNLDDDEPPQRPQREASGGSKKKSALERAEERENQQLGIGGGIITELPTEDNRYRNEWERKKFDAQDERERKEKRIRDICIKQKLNMKTVKASQIKVRDDSDELNQELKELLLEREAYAREQAAKK